MPVMSATAVPAKTSSTRMAPVCHPFGSRMLTARTTNVVNAAWPTANGRAPLAYAERNTSGGRSSHGTTFDEPTSQRSGKAAAKPTVVPMIACTAVFCPASTLVRSTGERAERDPEAVCEVAYPGHPHCEAEGDAGSQRIVEAD